MKNRNYGGMDYFKIVAAFLVVAIHTSLLTSFSAEADFVLTRIAARIAVPFFLMVTGYFTLSRYLLGKRKDFALLCRQVKKILLLYAAGIGIYLPVNLYAGHFEGMRAGDILRMAVFDGTFYHLWYLPAAVLGIGVVVLLDRVGTLLGGGNRQRCFWSVGGCALLLYTAGLFGDSYYGLLEPGSFIYGCYDRMFRLFAYTRNGFFYAPVFLWMGAWAARGRGKEKGRGRFQLSGLGVEECGWGAVAVYIIGFAVFFALMAAEGLALHRMGVQRHDSMYLALLPCMFFLFRILLNMDVKPAAHLRTVSTWIYMIHPLMILIVRGGAEAVHLEEWLVGNSLLHYLTVCLLSYVFASAGQKLFSGKGGPRSGGHSFRFPAGLRALFCAVNDEGKCVCPGRGISREDAGRERAWIELSRENIRQNAAVLQGLLAPGCRLMPVLKANAYGHGAVFMARELNACGIRDFCVATVSEAVELRKNGIRGEILILGYTHPGQFRLLRRYHLAQTVVDASYAGILDAYGKKIKVHVKIDTGMHRLGERCERIGQIERIFRYKNLIIKGIYTHLSADEAVGLKETAFTEAQGQALREVTGHLEKKGYGCPKVHLLASYGLLNYPGLAGDYARVGIALYGTLSNRKDMDRAPDGLRPVLSLKARVAVVKELRRGEAAGYGFGYVASRDRRIAVLAIGYADGLPRALSAGGGKALINGGQAPVIGYICMDQTIVDVTGIPGVRQGDIAVLIGRDGGEEITVYDLAERAGTITNEIFSRLGGRLGRVMV